MTNPEYTCATYVGPWPDIVQRILGICEFMEPRPNILCIKEKFGTLRVYVAKPDAPTDEFWDCQWDALHQQIERAMALSARSCDVCCKPGILRTETGWLRTLCDEHNAVHIKERSRT